MHKFHKVSFVVLGLMAALSGAEPLLAGPTVRPAARSAPTVVDSVRITRSTKGTNPDLVTYQVEATLLVGNNACDAVGVRVGLVRHQASDVLELLPTKMLPRDAQGSCPELSISSSPAVYRTVETNVTMRVTKTEDLVIANVGRLGRRTSLLELGSGEGGLAASGVLTRVEGAGGESTGLALEAHGQRFELDAKSAGLSARANSLIGHTVAVSGSFKTVTGVELTRQVLVLVSLDDAT